MTNASRASRLSVGARQQRPQPERRLPGTGISRPGSPRSRDDNVALFCENLRRYAAGEALQGLVDRSLGY